MLGKKIYFHYRGQEIRLASVFAEKNPHHYVDEPTGWLFKQMPDESKLRLRDFHFSVCDGIFVTDPELQTYVPGATVVPRALDEVEWPFQGVSDRTRPVVVHAPSRRGLKGTDFVLQAASELEREGVAFELRLVENLPHSEAARCYQDADIIVDQLRIGWYGVLAVEGMALGKPVIAYIRDDLWEAHKDTLPIINANPRTIKERLREVILSSSMRRRLSQSSRDYFLSTHSARKVAELLATEYGKSRVLDMSGLADFLDHQAAHAATGRKPAAALQASAERVRRFWYVWRADGGAAAMAMANKFLRNRLRR